MFYRINYRNTIPELLYSPVDLHSPQGFLIPWTGLWWCTGMIISRSGIHPRVCWSWCSSCHTNCYTSWCWGPLNAASIVCSRGWPPDPSLSNLGSAECGYWVISLNTVDVWLYKFLPHLWILTCNGTFSISYLSVGWAGMLPLTMFGCWSNRCFI